MDHVVALQATVYRFPVALSHVDRGVYRQLDVRLARHPSENERFLLARLFAYCALVESDPPSGDEGPLEFSKGGLSSPDEPALSQRTLDGRLLLWVEIGAPSPERLHKAAKASPRVVVVTHHAPALLRAEVAKARDRVHRLDEIELLPLDPAFLDEVAAQIGDRGTSLEVTLSDGVLYVTVAGASLSTPFVRAAF